MVVAFYFRLHLAYFPRPVVAIFARPEHRARLAVRCQPFRVPLDPPNRQGFVSEGLYYAVLRPLQNLQTGSQAANDLVVAAVDHTALSV